MTKQQKLNLDLIKLGGHNNLDGKQIATDLIKNQNLWISVIGGCPHMPLLPLRDMQGAWHIDTIQVLCLKENAKEIVKMSKAWKPTTVTTFTGRDLWYVEGKLPADKIALLEIWFD